MGDTIRVLPEGAEEDSWDHSLMLRQDKSLDRLSKALGVKKLSEFFDYSSYAEEYGGEVEPNFVDPSEAEETISALVEAVRSGHPSCKANRSEELLEELVDVLEKLKQAKEKQLRVRLSLIQ